MKRFFSFLLICAIFPISLSSIGYASTKTFSFSLADYKNFPDTIISANSASLLAADALKSLKDSRLAETLNSPWFHNTKATLVVDPSLKPYWVITLLAPDDMLATVCNNADDSSIFHKEILSKEEMPDLVISGINHGPNLGSDILYSGTVSCAMEGAMMGIPSIAVSLASMQSD